MTGKPLVPTAWTTGTTESLKTGTWRAALPRYVSAPSPCRLACPVDGDIAEWIARAGERDFRGAFEILVRNNPFPAVSGRVCHHPCEAACNRSGFDSPLAVRELERIVGDTALAEGWKFPPAPAEHAERIAVLGGGPSGLAAAYHLRRRGYRVTLFEALFELGGVMRVGIPAYRLPRAVLDGEIGRILELGIELRLGKPVATPAAFAELRAEFSAIYLAIGAGRPKRLPALDYERPWAIDGAAWLRSANAGKAAALGKRLVVIGGGSAAIDTARSARRLGHEVTLVALEREDEMPAQRSEIEEAFEEGVMLYDGAMVERVAEEGEDGLALECVRVNFMAGAEPGAFRVEPIGRSTFRIEADAVVSSTGQDPDLGAFSGALAARGALLDTDERQRTSAPQVYAGGDVASLNRFITDAIGMGKRAAVAIDSSFAAAKGAAAKSESGARSEPPVPLASIATFYYPKARRPAERRLGIKARLSGNAEVALPLSREEAVCEAERCFSCGTCIFCDNCLLYCPDLAVRRVEGGYEIDGDYCKGCGVCVKECPTGSMVMAEELR